MPIESDKRLYIQEVSVRDGLQIEPRFVPTQQKIALIDRISRTGVAQIEVTSFTSPKAIPALADAEAVMRGIQRLPGVEYSALIPNVRGCERALACGVDEINLVVSASETHNLANLRMTCEQSLQQLQNIIHLVDGRTQINVSLATTFGCPFEGRIATERVFSLIERVATLGVQRVSLSDTTGVANPSQVKQLCGGARQRWPHLRFSAHFHNTRGMGLANVVAALEAGIRHFDGSLGGLGGCPFAPGASGNVCTEDLVHMLQEMGYDCGVDIQELIAIAADMPGIVGHDVPGHVLKAGVSSLRYATPHWLGSSQSRLAGPDETTASTAAL